MDDITDLIDKTNEYLADLQILAQGYMEQVRLSLWGSQTSKSSSDEEIPTKERPIATHRAKTRIMRLSSLNESDGSYENELIPPPSLPKPSKNSASELSDHQSSEMFVRPKRAAMLKSAKCLKEPKLNEKLRRPSNFDKVKVKLEHEQRRSQMDAKLAHRSRENVRPEDSVIVLPTKELSIVELDSEDDMSGETSRKLVAKVKHQEILDTEDVPPAEETKITLKSVQIPKMAVGKNHLSGEKRKSTLTFTITTKKGKKKTVTHRPIKVEHLDDVDNRPKTRTPNRRMKNSGGSVYADALDVVQKIVLGNQNAVAKESKKPVIESNKLPNPNPIGALVELPTLSNVFDKLGRENELFNPLMQSQLNGKVEGFKNTESGRAKSTKENTPPSTTTPTVGQLTDTLVCFLTPTQTRNRTPSSLANVKKEPSGTSKVLALSNTGTALKYGGGTTSAKKLYSENSAYDFRKSLHYSAEERKKQGEQKHFLAAQQRETKEHGSAEHLEKLNKEQEEKCLKKQQEAQGKNRALEEIQRILQQQDDAAAVAKTSKVNAIKAKGIADQERKLLQQLEQNKRLLKKHSKFTFEMLHQDDSTDEEDTASSQRPPPPNWSRSNVRGPAISAQRHWPTQVIDSFFSVQPLSPDLSALFPKSSSPQLNRSSSAASSTPPPSSELPKY